MIPDTSLTSLWQTLMLQNRQSQQWGPEGSAITVMMPRYQEPRGGGYDLPSLPPQHLFWHQGGGKEEGEDQSSGRGESEGLTLGSEAEAAVLAVAVTAGCVCVCSTCVDLLEHLTSMEILRWIRFLRQTPVGDWTSSDDVPDAWSLSPSDPIFRFSCTISGGEKSTRSLLIGWLVGLFVFDSCIPSQSWFEPSRFHVLVMKNQVYVGITDRKLSIN